jgi:hypothetical protein
MELNSNLPVLVSAVIALIVVSVAAALTLAWGRRPRLRTLVGRLWLVAVVVIVVGVGVFWISTAMVEGPRRATVDRSLQARQQEELRLRLQKGGH